MLYHLFNIIYASFAVFGLYCMFEMLLDYFVLLNSPKSITIFSLNKKEQSKKTVRYLKNNLSNNDIIFIAKHKENKEFKLENEENLNEILIKALFTNK